ncbi:hypothetical protein F5I97DRAFT_1799934 [Phlebopus sp. FC_14]|nr:hypothetical protein F5I97DRAFT_1799934 [Phlebopus sp. FC_14]
MDRPVTSKPRGVCRYYNTARGCYAGDDCKFLHGPDERLTPHDKGKVCRYYVKGHCTRGDKCWFRHALPILPPDDERAVFDAEICTICLEKPTTYGLLTNCSHVFCLQCIRQWRDPVGKSADSITSGAIKCCPLCRAISRFVTPSTHFFPQGNPQKKVVIDAYKASMARVPCRYFQATSLTGKPCCPFGTDCFYQHLNPDGTPHIFRHGAKQAMNIYRRHQRDAGLARPRPDYMDPIQFLQHIFENPLTNLRATLDVIRASLPDLMERFGTPPTFIDAEDPPSPREDDEESEGLFEYENETLLLVCCCPIPSPP